MEYARIENGIVAEIITSTNPNKDFHATIVAQLVPATVDAVVGGTYSGGVFGSVPVVVQTETWETVRMKRNALLAACDHTQLADSPLGVTEKSAWADYRKLLRNITLQSCPPGNVVWPEAPTAG